MQFAQRSVAQRQSVGLGFERSRVHRARPTPLKCKNEYPVLPLGGGNFSPGSSRRVSQAQKAKVMSACGYVLQSVCPQLSFSLQCSALQVRL